jgi:hypothetical protein
MEWPWMMSIHHLGYATSKAFSIHKLAPHCGVMQFLQRTHILDKISSFHKSRAWLRQSRAFIQAMANTKPLEGLWLPQHLEGVYYGPDSVSKHLVRILPSKSSKAFIVTGNSLATKTNLIKQVEELLKGKRLWDSIGYTDEIDQTNMLGHSPRLHNMLPLPN